MDDDATTDTPPPSLGEADGYVRLDSRRLHALAHPLRMRLLGSLRLHGPDTATGLARRLGTNSGQTSYHLRQLAEVGLIEDDPDHSTARDRYWRACHDGTSWSSASFRGDPDDWAADTVVLGQAVRIHGRWLDEMLDRRDEWDQAWLDASTVSDWELHLTADRLQAMKAEVYEVIQRHLTDAEHDRPGAERVTVLFSAFPHAEPGI